MNGSEYSTWFTQLETVSSDRFIVLDDVGRLLGFETIEWRGFLSAVQKVDEGFVVFNVGDLMIYFYLEPRRDKAIQLSVEMKRENMERSISYKYTIGEIGKLIKEKQLKIESFGDEIDDGEI